MSAKLHVSRKHRDGIPTSEQIRGRVTFADAAAALLQDYRNKNRRSLVVAERRITKHLTPVFGG